MYLRTETTARREVRSPDKVQHDAQPSPKASPKAARSKPQQIAGAMETGAGGTGVGAAAAQTIPKPMGTGQGARPKEVQSRPNKNRSPSHSKMRRSYSNPEVRGNEDWMENRKFRFTWKPTSQESLDKKSGILNRLPIMIAFQ